MVKTTIYLPEELKASLERLAAEERTSEAELIREAIRAGVARRGRPRPRVPLVDRPFGDPSAAQRVDELLSGFGTD